MTQQVERLPHDPSDLSSISRTHVKVEENNFCPKTTHSLTFKCDSHVYLSTSTHTQTHTVKTKKEKL